MGQLRPHCRRMLTASFVKSQAREVGFDLCGIASAQAHPRLHRLAAWVASGFAGDMTYLERSLDERMNPASVLPTVRSVISLGVIYNSPRAVLDRGARRGHAAISRYAWGDDYHEVLRNRLRRLVRALADAAGHGFEAFSSVDSGPVQERVFAEQAGLGWIGKNTCLINEAVGSWIFLAAVLTNADLPPDRSGLDQCGSCTRCLEACPTGALVEPYSLDANTLSLVLDHRIAQRGGGAAAAGHSPAGLRLRHLSGRLPLESARRRQRRPGLGAARRSAVPGDPRAVPALGRRLARAPEGQRHATRRSPPDSPVARLRRRLPAA